MNDCGSWGGTPGELRQGPGNELLPGRGTWASLPDLHECLPELDL